MNDHQTGFGDEEPPSLISGPMQAP
jgi:hypothetical protein